MFHLSHSGVTLSLHKETLELVVVGQSVFFPSLICIFLEQWHPILIIQLNKDLIEKLYLNVWIIIRIFLLSEKINKNQHLRKKIQQFSKYIINLKSSSQFSYQEITCISVILLNTNKLFKLNSYYYQILSQKDGIILLKSYNNFKYYIQIFFFYLRQNQILYIMIKQDFRKELAETAQRIVTPGKGILAADESQGTIGKKFVQINVENTEEHRRAYRELLFTTEGIENYISGVILFSETIKHTTKDGKKLLEVLHEKGIIPGIKVDKGIAVIPGTNDESATLGLDSLASMAAEYYGYGCRFAKWRAVLKIGNGLPSDQAIQENAWGLARYAAICQENGLVPIVEPEILADGDHSIEVCQKVTEKVLSAVFRALAQNNVFLEGALLKPNMVTPGSQNPDRANVTAAEIGYRTALALSRTVPPALVGVVFLSGGQSEEEASLNLNEMNKLTNVRKPWSLSFSYGRALQNTAVKTWHGKEENWHAAQQALIVRAKANSEATLGKYQGGQGGAAGESLFVADYKY
ncbi:Fructose-bisphosphate aldolase 5 [Paramecium bursaria]